MIVMVILASVIGLWWFLYVRLADPNAFLADNPKEKPAQLVRYNVRAPPSIINWSFFIPEWNLD